MFVRTLQSIEEFKAIEPSWRKLHESSPDSSFFNSFDYTWVWWDIYQSLGELCIYVVLDGEAGGGAEAQVLAIAPMYKTRSHLTRFFSLPTLRFVGRGGDVTPVDLNVLFCADDAAARASGQLLLSTWQADTNVQRLLFEELPERSRFYSMVQQHLRYLIEDTQIRWVANLPESWQEFTAGLSRNTRKRIKHRRNRLNDAQTLTMQVCTDQGAKEEALAALITLHKERRHSKGDSAAFSTSEYVQFHESLLATPSAQPLTQFITLRDDDKIVGVEYMYVSNNTLLFNQTGFSPEYESVSPGHNMMVFAIENAFDQSVQSLDLLHGDYQYKHSYASDKITTLMVTSYSSNFHYVFARLLQGVKSLKARSL